MLITISRVSLYSSVVKSLQLTQWYNILYIFEEHTVLKNYAKMSHFLKNLNFPAQNV